MYIPTTQSVITAGLAMTGLLKDRTPTPSPLDLPISEASELTPNLIKTASTVASGSVLDYAVEKCLDADGNTRCSKPFLVTKSTCYEIEWHTEGVLTHTTAEVRDAGSGEMVYYRDTNGQWTPGKGELVYLDFKPKIVATGNQTVDYTVKTCE